MGINMNEVTLQYFNKASRACTIQVNSNPVIVNFIQVYKNANDFNGKIGYSCQVVNDWNISNPLTFQASTVKGLMGKLKRHKYNLKPLKYTG